MIRILESLENKEGKLVVNVKDSEGELKELLNYIKKVSDAGHTFEVVVDPGNDNWEKSFEIDGDGAFRIDDIEFESNKDSNDEIKMITYNSFEVTKLINEVTSNVEGKIREIEMGNVNYYGDKDGLGGVIAEVPFGAIFGNSMLSNIGPKIKIRMKMLGDIVSNVETEVKPYGINNAYVEMRIYLEVTARVILPFVSEKVVISNVIPLSMNIVQGSVPDGYVYSYK